MNSAEIEREIMEYDVIVVGAGPAGLACAIRLKQLKEELSVAVIEKGAEIGAHILSGAVIEPGTTLLPLSMVLKELHLPTATYEGSPVEPVSLR